MNFFNLTAHRPKKSLGVSGRRAKRKGVWGKEFLPACFPPAKLLMASLKKYWPA